MDEKRLPLGIKVWGILNYLSGFFMLILGIILLFYEKIISFLGLSFTISPPFGSINLIAIIFIILGIIDFYTAKGIWAGKNWARIISIFFLVLGGIGSIYLIFSKGVVENILFITIYGLIIYYLIFNKNVQDFFS